MRLRDKVIVKASLGFGMSIIIGIIITAVTSTDYAGGKLTLCSAEFNAFIGDELLAFLIQAILLGLYGALAMGGSVVYEIEQWSIVKVTLIHFCTVMISFFALAFFLRWIAITDVKGIVFMFTIMAIPYVIIWLVNYIAYKLQVNTINEKLEKFKSNEPTK